MNAFLIQSPHLKPLQNIVRLKNLKVYLVGGFLRDYLLGRPCLDFDFSVEKGAVALARIFSRKIRGSFVLLDEEHGCARVVRKEQGKLVTFDFADFRAQGLKGDLSHRDFTINTFCIDIQDINEDVGLSDILLDWKNGRKDLKQKTIRMVSPNIFKEDPLRLMRAFSLQANLEFKIANSTLAQIKKDKDLLSDVSAERVREELFKVLSSPRTSGTLRAMDRVGLLKVVMPQIEVMYNVKQGGYHHLDVWPHSLETVVQLEKILALSQSDPDLSEYLNESLAGTHRRSDILKLAALLHDIGKPDTRRKENGRMSFHGHEHVGRNIVRSIANMLKFSVRERHMLEDMVLWHLRPGYLSNFKNSSERSIFRYLRDTKEEAVSILLLSLADQRSTCGPLTTEYDQKHHEEIVQDLVQRYFEKKKHPPLVRLIDGHDLIKVLKLKPSPVFAKILRDVEESHALGKIKTREEALELARKVAQNN